MGIGVYRGLSMGFPDSGIGRVRGGLVDRSLLEQIEGLVTIK